MKFTAIYALLVGTGMLGQWAASYVNRQIPELKTEPIRIAFHLVAKILTALLLIISGIALLTGAAWAQNLYLVGLGMLFYTSIVSPGYFAQKGEWAWLGMFSAIIILGLVSLMLLF